MIRFKSDTLADRVRTFRDQRNLTQEALATRSGVKRLTIINLEKGRQTDPKLSTLIKLARTFGVTLETLVNYQG